MYYGYCDIDYIYINLPDCVKACTVPNEMDGYTIVINARLSESAKERAIKHELQHIKKNDCYNEYMMAKDLEADIEVL